MTTGLPFISRKTEEVHLLTGLRDVVAAPGEDRFDGFVCDVWGVLHDGISAYSSAPECLIRLRALGKPVVLLSNAPRPSASIISQLAGFGYKYGPGGHYDHLVTSGDATRLAIESRYYGNTLLHIGPDRDLPLLENLDVECAGITDSQFALCTGLYNDETETPEDYRDLLRDMLARDLPLLCANPDNVVMRGGKLIYCAGAVARSYAAMGGAVTFFGKPYPGVYQHCLAAISQRIGRPAQPARVLTIGDGLLTDVAGSQAAGMPALFISGGIHAQELDAKAPALGPPVLLDALSQACARAKIKLPDAVMHSFIW